MFWFKLDQRTFHKNVEVTMINNFMDYVVIIISSSIYIFGHYKAEIWNSKGILLLKCEKWQNENDNRERTTNLAHEINRK